MILELIKDLLKFFKNFVCIRIYLELTTKNAFR